MIRVRQRGVEANVPSAPAIGSKAGRWRGRLVPAVLAVVLAGFGLSCRRSDTTTEPAASSAGVRAGVNNLPSQDDRLPSLLIITIDTLRADHLGCYGYFRDTSPTLDRLAEDAVLFERCYAPVAQTLPTHTSIFTGVYPYEHGFQSNLAKLSGQTWAASPRLKPLAAALSDAGYTTAAFVSAEPVKRISGLDAGFQHWVEPDDKKVGADVTTDAFLDWLAGEPPHPWFSWIHYFDCHAPYEPPPPYDALFEDGPLLDAFLDERGFADSALKHFHKPRGDEGVRVKATSEDHNLYDGELRFVDDQIERLFEQLRRTDRFEDLVIVITSDHGEALGQHGLQGHGDIWGEQLHVPLLICVPGVPSSRSAVLTSSIDILPTLAGLAPDLPLEAAMSQWTGTDVLTPDDAAAGVFAQTPRPVSSSELVRTSILRDGWRFIRDVCGEDRLYDLRVDPYELHNVIDRFPVVAAELRRDLEDLIVEQQRRGRDNEAGRLKPVGQEHIRALQSLGYVDDDDFDEEDDD